MRELIEDGINRLLQEQVTPAVLASSASGEWAGGLWELLEQSGYTRALCSADARGSDATWSDAYPLLVASGYHTLPLPLAETLLGNWLMEQACVAPGDGLAHGPVGIADPGASPPLSLVRNTTHGWRVSGCLAHVPWGRHCGLLVAQVEHAGGNHLIVVQSEGLPVRVAHNLAGEPRDSFDLVDAVPLAVAPWPAAAPSSLRLLGALLRSAQTAGAAQRLLQQTVRYANERVQFGKALAQFQAVRQQVAAAASETTAVSSAADHACSTIGVEPADFAVAVAKIVAGEAAGKVASTAHAVHGAMGFTAEHSLHHATQRLWSWRAEFGSASWWSRQLGEAVCRQGADQLWPSMVDGKLAVPAPSAG
jgi:acyl-CoA dehydrogenase